MDGGMYNKIVFLLNTQTKVVQARIESSPRCWGGRGHVTRRSGEERADWPGVKP